MSGCLVSDKGAFWLKLKKLCDESATMGMSKGSIHIQQGISHMLEEARTSPKPDEQIALLKEALEEYYKAPNPYGRFINTFFPLGSALLLFNPKYDQALDDSKTVSSTFEETAKESRIIRSRNFIDSKFKDAPNAKLFFRRSLKNDLVETFLVRRSGEDARYFTSQEEMNENVRAYKQELLDRVFDFFKNDPFLVEIVKDLPTTMYDESGTYTGVISKIKSVIDSRLDPKVFDGKVKPLEQYYKEYRDGDRQTKLEAERFLKAYNAWIMLQNFDTLVEDTFGSIIKVGPTTFNRHDSDLHKYEIKGRATNMWNNWTNSDDIADMSEVISEVTQALIDTSKMYKWGSEEAYSDRYVSFHDFNYVIGWVKRRAFDNISDTINITELDGINGVSLYTKKVLLETLAWNRQNGNVDADGSPKEVTWKQLVSRINENPQRYLHAIFDILCNTDILDKFTVNDYEKSLIWSFYKEVFGGDGNPRSLYRLHTVTQQDNVYQIITQVAASTFPEDYLQYYEKLDGSISTRLLQDFALESIRNTVFQDIQQTATTLTQDQYSRYGITSQPFVDQPNFLEKVSINIPIDSELSFNIQSTIDRVEIPEYTPEQAELIWKSNKFQKMVKDLLGINFEGDPDLKAAYLEIVRSPYGAVKDLSNLLGRIVFNAVVNNDFVPKHPNTLTDVKALHKFIKNQYGKSLAPSYIQGIIKDTGYIPVLPVNLKDAALGNIAMAMAINSNLLAAAQSKTGEGTSLANYTLSRMRNFYQNQIEMQCKREASAVKDLSFVVNSNGLFEGILSRRELKTQGVNQQSTQFSDQQSFQLSFINDFIAGFIPNPDDNSYIKNGRVSFLPTVNSDKTQIDGLLVNLHAKSRILDEFGRPKSYIELSDSEIESEMGVEFQPMYERIITNINVELGKVCSLLPNAAVIQQSLVGKSIIEQNHILLNAINSAFANDESLGKKPKARITEGLHRLITKYNQTHRRNPIMLSPQVHYVFDSNGLLTSNKTLEALWGRFSPIEDEATYTSLSSLYANETEYISFLQREGIEDVVGSQSFFRYQDYLTVKDLINMDFKVLLRGSDEVVRHDQPEIQFLRGEVKFTEAQLNDSAYAHLVALNNEMKNWVNDSGLMIIAKGIVDGKLTEITAIDQLSRASSLQLHPMISKLNRLDYLCSQQYTVATVGSHYVHKGGAKEGSILVEEAKRWLASNKRNVAATSTVHLFQNKQLDGAPSTYNVAIIEDVFFDLYSAMGDMYLEGHAPLDGGMFVNAWMSDLENNSLAGEKAGLDKKQFGTFYSELYGAGGIVKTAGFAATNARMRRQKAWVNLQRNMSDVVWTKEFAGPNGEDIPEVIDITKDYFGRPIDYTQAIKGQSIMYKRPAHDNPSQMAAYKLLKVESLGNNQYKIYEVEIDQYGAEVGEVQTRDVLINTNWALYTEIFGGYLSLEIGSDNKLTWSENSNKLMVHAINNVGYRKDTSRITDEDFGQFGLESTADLEHHLATLETGLDQDDIWQPLKYSDIHYTPNIGAIKSLQFNLNPDGDAVLTSQVPLNFMTMRLAQLGIQLDKEHHADAAEVSMPTQIIQACANRSFTSEYAREIYNALSTLTRQATQQFLDGIGDILTGDDPTKLVESVTALIVDNLLHQSSEDTAVNAIMKQLLEKAEEGKEIKFSEDIKGKIPWSDPTISNKLFSSLSTTLTNLAVKMKFAGTLSVICPTERVEKIYGDNMLSSFTKVFDESGSTRTATTEDNLKAYQESVRAGEATDAEGNNLLVFDIARDVVGFPIQGESESVTDYQRRIRKEARLKRLSMVSGLKPQHNYIMEFEDGTTEAFTYNTPEDLYRIKNLVAFGKEVQTDLLPPLEYDSLLEDKRRQVRADGLIDPRLTTVYGYLSKPILTQESYLHELGVGRSEVKKMFGLFKSEANGGLSINALAELIYGDNSDIFTDDVEVRDMIIDILQSARTTGDLRGYEQRMVDQVAEQLAKEEWGMYETALMQQFGMSSDEYFDYYEKQNAGTKVSRIYENVEEGRALSAYNVRFTDEVTGLNFQMFDLDSINLLFKLNNLWTNEKKPIKGYTPFQKLSPEKQQKILNQIFGSSAFAPNYIEIHNKLTKEFGPLPRFDKNFIANLEISHPGRLVEVISALYQATKPRVHKVMQSDLFKLSQNYKGRDRRVYVNGTLISPTNISTDAYETILPQVYKTVFGLQEGDDVQAILKDKDFFVKRGLSRYACKLDHSMYDYELKNFSGDHYYILDQNKGIPENFEVLPIFIEQRKGKYYRVDSDGHVMYELSSKDDVVCKVGDVQVIVSKNPLFYVQNLNYNTLKVSPARVTQESYDELLGVLRESKRVNSKNALKAITNPDGSIFDLKTFKEFNTAIDELSYDTVRNISGSKDFKSVAQICRNILRNGRELHTSFKTSLKMIAGRIPAQSQQSFMIQKVVGFDSSGLNTAMVSTFQLFLQGSDLDIDAVTMLGFEFDKSGKFVGWSPYFNIESDDHLRESMKMPLPTGQTSEIYASEDAPNNFFEVYDKYFGTLFVPITLPSGKIKTIDGVPELQLNISSPEGLELLSEFLRDVNEYGINIKGPIVKGLVKTTDPNFFTASPITLENGTVVQRSFNLYQRLDEGGLGIRPAQTYQIAQQLLDIVNRHNQYIVKAEEHLQDKMAKNYVVYYMYKVAEAPCNQTESQVGLDISTRDVKSEAANSAMANASDSYAPGRAVTKHKSVGEGQVGKACVGIGAVGIKANSTTQFYLSEILNYGSEWDKEKLLFKRTVYIGNKGYRGFANMYTDKQFTEDEVARFQAALEFIDSLESPDQVTQDVAVNIASLLSIAVDNAKDLALAKINSGPKMMGLYAYGLTLGIPIKELVAIINSEEGRILTSLTEGSYFNNDSTAFKVADAIKKLDGDIGGDLTKYSYICKKADDTIVKSRSEVRINNKPINIVNTQDALFAFMYKYYSKWIDAYNQRKGVQPITKASSLSGMVKHLLQFNRFDYIYNQAKSDLNDFYKNTIAKNGTKEYAANWLASMKQMVSYIQGMSAKIQKFNSPIGRDLRVLAQGAEEMRILGSILSINKGLKASMSDAETFIDTIENLIYNRKEAMGMTPKESDRIDFHRFMVDEEYQREKIDVYEKVKHSVNILHLISKVPHFNGYLKTQMIPTAFFMTSSIKYRTIHKYRQNVDPENTEKPVSIFKLFGVDSRKEKESILKGLENLIHFKMFTRWVYDSKLQLKVPAGFSYFSKKGSTVVTPESGATINLWTEAGLATFKKYMEEVVIPSLRDNPEWENNEFVKNLIKISYNKTPVHSSVTTYSLQGDLMTKQGRQAELNARMFADFQELAGISFQPENGIPSLADAFYLYAQYCYMGKKGKKSLMALFDSDKSRGDLARSFTEHIASMDVDGEINCSKEELIIWCAPYGNQRLRSKFGYVTSNQNFGVSLKKRIEENVKLTEEQREAMEEAQDQIGEEGMRSLPKQEKFGTYKSEYITTQYDRLTRNHFLVPSTADKVSSQHEMELTLFDSKGSVSFEAKHDMIQNVVFDEALINELQARIASGEITKFSSVDDIINTISNELAKIHIPYKVSLYHDSKREINFGIIQKIIDQIINC